MRFSGRYPFGLGKHFQSMHLRRKEARSCSDEAAVLGEQSTQNGGDLEKAKRTASVVAHNAQSQCTGSSDSCSESTTAAAG